MNLNHSLTSFFETIKRRYLRKPKIDGTWQQKQSVMPRAPSSANFSRSMLKRRYFLESVQSGTAATIGDRM